MEGAARMKKRFVNLTRDDAYLIGFAVIYSGVKLTGRFLKWALFRS